MSDVSVERARGSSRPGPPDVRCEPMAIWIGLTRIRRRLQRLVERRLKRVGLPPLIWHDALLLLALQPGFELCAPDLEQKLSLRQYQVSRLIEHLAEGGFVMRRRLHVIGRPLLIRLTERGRDLQQRMAEVYTSAVDAAIIGQFSEQEAALLVALLGRFYHAPSASAEPVAGKVHGLRHFNSERCEVGALAELRK
jgi:DNA-binding MarR family transcriptional regulator